MVDRYGNVSVISHESDEKNVADGPDNEDHGGVIICLQ